MKKIAQLYKEDAKLYRQLANNAEKRAALLECETEASARRGGGNGNGPP